MRKKYRLDEENPIVHNGKKLYRIIALKSFDSKRYNINISVGDVGGYVESEDNLSQDGFCWICSGAMVYDNAKILDDAAVYGAEVFGNAIVSETALIFDKAKVFDNAQIKGLALIDNYAMVFQNACVRDNARVLDYAKVFGSAVLDSYAQVAEYAIVCGNAYLANSVFVNGTSWVMGNSNVSFNKTVGWSGGYGDGCLVDVDENVDLSPDNSYDYALYKTITS